MRTRLEELANKLSIVKNQLFELNKPSLIASSEAIYRQKEEEKIE